MTTAANWPSFIKTWHKSSYPGISPTRPEISLTGKTVIITGGGAGIGAAIAKSVAPAGASHLAIIGRRSALLSKTAADIKASTDTKTEIFPVTADLTNKEEVDKAIEQIHQEFRCRPLDILISNAGYFTDPRLLGTETVEEWTTDFGVNVKAVYLITFPSQDSK
jgi:NAD(P)-dependent dehydrogenase (short-subunit alcohol dehydrogenase family)